MTTTRSARHGGRTDSGNEETNMHTTDAVVPGATWV